MTASPITEFMQSPLVTWIKTFSEEESRLVHFNNLCDGVFLHDVMLQIDSRPPYRGVSLAVDDVTVRIRNLDILVRNVRAFYEDALGQLVITKLPDLIALSKDPETDSSLDDVKGLLLLILGCAVQCDKKEQFIERIKQLNVEVQHAIVECIQQVTDNPETVWTQEWSDLSLLAEEHHEPTFQLLVQHLRRLVKERDELWHNCNSLVLEKEGGEKCTTPAWSGSPGSISDKHHLGVELADSKAKLRRLRQELEEKNELLAEIKEELEQNKGLVNKLRQENLDLLQDARAAKAYRDELDILRERVSKVDKLENEIQRYKDKLNELEFYKSRVEELREDNRILVETKEMLEDQLESSRKRADLVLDLENELLRYKAQINEFTLERDSDRDRIQELIEENSQLQLSTKHSMNESVNLMAELDQLRSQGSPGLGDSLSDELNKDAQSRLRKLELENQRLLNIIENLRVSSFHENSEKVLELEKENKRLSLKVAQLQDSGTRELQRCLEAEHKQQELTQEATKLQDMLEAVKTNSERQWIELQREKEALVELVDTLRHRNQKSNDARLKDIEAENKKLVESTQEMKGQISRLEYEKQQLQKVNEKLKENSERLSEIESQKLEVDRENADLHRAIAAFKLACDKYEKLEQDFSDLQVEYCRLNRVLENMKNTCTKIDELEQSNISLVIEKQKLMKTLESLRASSQKLVDLEQEKEELKQTNQLLRRNIEALKVDRGKFEQMELDLMSLNTENQKLQKTLETTTKKIEETEIENQSLENENQKLQKTIETLKVSTRRFNDLERENTDLEADNHKLEREKKSLEKEVSRLKQAIEVKDCTIDECSSKVSTLERENKRLTKDLENVNHLNCRVKELEKENREIMQQSVIDKKTLIALREDLVNEKIKTQQLSNELEKLNSDLQKIGLKKEKLMVAEQTQDEDRYKALENMMEEALKKSLEIKEEKIHSLEKHLEELTSHNTELKEELGKLRQQYEAVQQTQADQCATQTDRHNEKEATASVTKEISDLKDHLEEIERTNSSLQEENRNLRLAVTNAREQLNSLQQQMASLQHQSAVLSEQNGSLQSLNAKLQVENTTLQSQNTSLSSQTTNLSTQYASLEADREQLLHHQEELQTAHELLVSDHEALQKLHEQLSSEYESLLNELGSQKSSQKSLKSEYKNLKEKYQVLISAQDEVTQLQDVLEKERELLKSDSKSLTNLRAEHSRLKEDFRLLHTNNEKLKIEYKSLQVEYKTLKTENNTLKLKHTELQGELAECRDHMNGLDVEVSKLHSKCEMLSHVNATLEEDRKSLMTQVSTLLTQYHELLTQTLEDKDHFHEEEKSFADKLNNLQRQKEKLEEKIMEQYRRMENYSPKNPSISMLRTLANDGEGLRGFGANLVRRVRRAGSELMNRVPRSARSKDRDKDRSRRSRDSTDATDSLDTVSVGSGSLSTESPDSGSDATIRKINEDTRDLQRNDSFSDLTDQSSKRRSTTSLNTLHIYKQMSSNIVNGDDNEKSMTGLPQVDLSAKELSLGNPGTRRAVYYADEHDTIPTRDVGPHVESSNNKKQQDGSLKNGTQSTNNSDLEMLNPDQTRIVCNLTSENNLKSTKSDALNSSLTSGWLIHSGSRNSLGSLPATLTSSPILGNRLASSYSLISKCESLNDTVPSYLSKSSIWQNNSLDGSILPNLDHTANDQNKPQRQNSSENGLVETSSTATPSASPLHNRHSRLLQDSPPLTNDLTTRNNNLSPNLSSRRPNLLTVQQPRLPNNTKPLPDKTSNIVASTGNLARDKPPDNSIWYEYGCV